MSAARTGGETPDSELLDQVSSAASWVSILVCVPFNFNRLNSLKGQHVRLFGWDNDLLLLKQPLEGEII